MSIFSFFKGSTIKDKADTDPSVPGVAKSPELQVISYLKSLVDREELITDILKKFDEGKNLPGLERERAYIKTYYALEDFISQEKPPIVKVSLTKEGIRQEIRKNFDIYKDHLSFKVIFLQGNEQQLALLELSVKDFAGQILLNLGVERLKKVMSNLTKGTIFEQVLVTENGLDFGLLYKGLSQIDNEKYPALLKSFYNALRREIVISFGKNVADSLVEKNYSFIKDAYEYEVIARFLDVLPEDTLPRERVAYLTREELETEARKAVEEKVRREIAEKAAEEMKVTIKDLDETKKAMLNLLEDLEESKKQAEILANDLKKFKLAVDNTSDMIVITDPEAIVLYGNNAVERVTGYKAEEAIGKKSGALWKSPMPQEFYQKMWDTIKTQKKTFEGEIQNKRKNGELYTAVISISPILNEKGEIEFFVGIERDITKEQEVDRMKTEFISLASHQLRTPLSAMKWFSEMLLAGDAGALNPEQLDFVNNINDSNERMIDLVNGLLNISRIESGRITVEPKPTDLKELVGGVINELQEKISNKKLEVSLSVQENLPFINIDSKMIRQVYINLLTNAVKYTNSGGKIQIFIFVKDNEIISRISDSGVGIPKEEQSKIFERFFRASNAVKIETDGSGLGLYLAKTIVESSGGKIGFESEEGKGSIFWFSLPLGGMKPKAGEVSLSP